MFWWRGALLLLVLALVPVPVVPFRTDLERHHTPERIETAYYNDALSFQQLAQTAGLSASKRVLHQQPAATYAVSYNSQVSEYPDADWVAADLTSRLQLGFATASAVAQATNATCPHGCAPGFCKVVNATYAKCTGCQGSLFVSRAYGICGCPPGKYQPSGTTVSCKDCEKGFFCLGGKSTGVAGTPIKASCSMFGTGLTTMGERAVSSKLCVNDFGYYYTINYTTGNFSAVPCGPDTYGPGLRKQRNCTSCPNGYTTAGKEMQSSIRSCIPRVCGPPPDPPGNSTWEGNCTGLIGNSTRVGALNGTRCNATCAPGFTGAPFVICNSNTGNWSRPVGSCSPIVCGAPPPPPANSSWIGNCAGGMNGTTCRAACANGYAGSPSITCILGTWTNLTSAEEGSSNNCTLTVCGEPPPPPANSSWPSSCTGTVHGTRCNATCDFGFRGGASIRCNNSMWVPTTNTTGMCNITVCGAPPPAPANSSWIGNCTAGSVHGTVCEAACSVGFYGAPSITCSAGTWVWSNTTGGRNCSRYVCGLLPPAPDNSTWNSNCSGSVHGRSCNATCAYGFVGSAQVTCINGTWNWSDATNNACTITACGDMPAAPANGTWAADCNGSVHGTRCNATCAAGLEGTPYVTCDAGNWSNVIGRCSKYCPPGQAGCGPCPSGTFQEFANQGCTPCPPGFSSPLGATVCSDTRLAVGSWHTCAIVSPKRKVVCDGWNNAGQQRVPEDLSEVTSVCAGEAHTCAVTGGRVVCWGDNTFKQSQPPLTLLTPVVYVRCGAAHTCALTISRRVVCWGCMTYTGQAVGLVVPNEAANNVTQLTSGRDHVCVTIADNGTYGTRGRLFCFGEQFGYSSMPSNTIVDHVAAFWYATCIIRSGKITCFGDTSRLNVILGNPNTLTDAVMIAGGWNFAVAIRRNGAVLPWGKGALGLYLPDNLNATTAFAFYQTVCFRTQVGALECFGDDANQNHLRETFSVGDGFRDETAAAAACSNYGAQLATLDQIQRDWGVGAEWCKWSYAMSKPTNDGVPVLAYPMQQANVSGCSDEWPRIYQLNNTQANSSDMYAANCYGKKPYYSVSSAAPANLTVRPFQGGLWSLIANSSLCGDLPPPPGNGSWPTNCSIIEGTRCTATCDPNFIAPPVATCVQGQWNVSASGCSPIPIECGVPPSPPANSIWATNCTGLSNGTMCNATCNFGYEGEPYITCDTNVWSAKATGSCKLQVCGDPPPPLDNSTWVANCSGTTHGSRCNATCDYGFVGTPAPWSTCVAGNWSDISGNCSLRACGVPPKPPASSTWDTNCTGFLHGMQCTASCSSGYVGGPYMTCDAGKWSTVIGNCSVAVCGAPPPAPANSTWMGPFANCSRRVSGVLVHPTNNTICNATCAQYFLGSASTTCVADKYAAVWTQVEGGCTVPECKGEEVPDPPANGSWDPYNCTTGNGTSCWGVCNYGYTGSPYSQCVWGNWSKIIGS